MASNLSPEEVHALVGDAGGHAATAIEPRDFRQPRRLSPEQLVRHKRTAQRVQKELGRLAEATFRVPTPAEIVGVSEASMPEVVRELEEPFAALLFDCGGQSCWTIWDISIALGAVERMLGSTKVEEQKPRALSAVERSLVQSLLVKITTLLGSAFGLEPKNPRYVQDFVSLYAVQDAQDQGDPQRLCVQVGLQGEYGSGTIRVYLGGPRLLEPANGAAQGKDKHRPTLPAHISDLEVQLTAELASVELPLKDVLAIEPGDVIPLDVEVDSPLALYVEDEACGSARWGERSGRIALRITEFTRRGGAQPGNTTTKP
ncbi:MAG: FliM/FliN family flagellar motor switch protein [Planctomycetes bacterium]|nr:FliM/FliN family flagellar motor switch protein [Planctomycetota bacterium]